MQFFRECTRDASRGEVPCRRECLPRECKGEGVYSDPLHPLRCGRMQSTTHGWLMVGAIFRRHSGLFLENGFKNVISLYCGISTSVHRTNNRCFRTKVSVPV